METERVRRAQRTAASANGVRAEQTASPSPDASGVVPTNQTLHWASVYFIILMAGSILMDVIEWIAAPVLFSSQLYETVSPQTVVIALYFERLVLWLALSVLGIRLTHKRFACSRAWKLFTLLSILLIPVLTYFFVAHDPMLIVEGAVVTVLPVSAEYLISGLLFSLIPLAYFGWVLWMKQSLRNHGQVIQKVKTSKAGQSQGLHWAVALLILVASNTALFFFIYLLDRGSDTAVTMNDSEWFLMGFYGLYFIVFIWVVIDGMLWIRLTRKRYANSVNWQVCTVAFWVRCVVLFYVTMNAAAMGLSDWIGYDGVLTISMPVGMVIASMLGFLLPLLYYWRVIRRANAKSDDREFYAPGASVD